MSVPISESIPPSSSPLVSTCLFWLSLSVLLPWNSVHLYHFSRLHIHVLIYDICFISYFLHSDSLKFHPDLCKWLSIVPLCIPSVFALEIPWKQRCLVGYSPWGHGQMTWRVNNTKNNDIFFHSPVDGHLGCFHVLAVVIGLLSGGMHIHFGIKPFCGYIEFKQICWKYLILSRGLISKLEWKAL